MSDWLGCCRGAGRRKPSSPLLGKLSSVCLQVSLFVGTAPNRLVIGQESSACPTFRFHFSEVSHYSFSHAVLFRRCVLGANQCSFLSVTRKYDSNSRGTSLLFKEVFFLSIQILQILIHHLILCLNTELDS